MRNRFVFLLFLLVTLICVSQEEDYIFGQLVDGSKNEPVVFASIRLKGAALGVISNIDGTFRIPMYYKSIGEVLEISCIGYGTKLVAVNDLKDTEANIIILQPSAFELNEAVVSANIKKLSAKQIIKIAVNSISQNYPLKEFGLIGYYRDYQVKNGNYANLGEAIIGVEDTGFKEKNILNNKYLLYSYNINQDFEIDEFARQPYDYEGYNKVVPNAKLKNEGGNEFITLRMHDAIRNYGLESFSFVDDISTDFIENHKFSLKGKTNFNKESVYEIDMVFRDDTFSANGTIYVNTKDFAIHKLEYAVYKRKKPKDISKAINDKERFSNGFIKLNREMLYHIQTEYARGANKKMFLNYISFYNKVLVQRPAPFKSRFSIYLEDKSFRIRVNKKPGNLEKIKNRDFMITYRNDFVPIREFWFQEDELAFVVCPHLKYKKAEDIFDVLFTEKEDLEVADVKYTYGNIKDSLGNKLDERKWEYLHQYREFFVQEIILDNNVKNSNRLMRKDLSLDSDLQLKHSVDIKKEYWKNTPLPTIKK
ncbi:carboxypeptidase-like regulatory domain-containing protein [Maribacter sp. CXY002]|uniref:carboxypeptidase-like regulatory domain-containing protein n=1 Tax=Maribacter luteocoastalis TaxID=3407671 RepID=UPI003B66BCB0